MLNNNVTNNGKELLWFTPEKVRTNSFLNPMFNQSMAPNIMETIDEIYSIEDRVIEIISNQ